MPEAPGRPPVPRSVHCQKNSELRRHENPASAQSKHASSLPQPGVLTPPQCAQRPSAGRAGCTGRTAAGAPAAAPSRHS